MKVLDDLERRAKELYPHARMLTGAEALAPVEAVRAGAHTSMLLRTRQETQADEDASDAFDAALAKLEGLVKP